MTDDCISAQELADRLGLSVFSVRHMIRTGELAAAPGRPDHVARAAVAAYWRTHELPVTPPPAAPDNPPGAISS